MAHTNAYIAGYRAFLAGIPHTDCPFFRGDRRQEWIKGWVAGDAMDCERTIRRGRTL